MSLDISFGHAQPLEALEIQKLYRQLVDDSNVCVLPESIEALIQDDFNHLIVGRINKKIVATGFLTICRDVMYGDQPYAVLENIVVDIECRKQKIGQKLMAYIRSVCKSKRCTKIMLLSSSKRVEAHSFFEKCGYEADIKRGFVNYVNRQESKRPL
jgi:N-acetylglutamate synthase-like GNAT family acetyltransferase